MNDYAAEILALAQREGDCPECEGSGLIPNAADGENDECYYCAPWGKNSKSPGRVPLIRVREACLNDNHRALTRSVCPDCNGTGGTWRTLRRECDYCKGQPDPLTVPWDEVITCMWCQGRGWLPVSKDEAFGICIDYCAENSMGDLNPVFSIMYEDDAGWNCSPEDTPIKDMRWYEDRYAAVFAAVREVSGGG